MMAQGMHLVRVSGECAVFIVLFERNSGRKTMGQEDKFAWPVLQTASTPLSLRPRNVGTSMGHHSFVVDETRVEYLCLCCDFVPTSGASELSLILSVYDVPCYYLGCLHKYPTLIC